MTIHQAYAVFIIMKRLWLGNSPMLLGAYRRFSIPVASRFKTGMRGDPRTRDIHPETVCVIDGFPCSGNSSSTRAIVTAQPDDVLIAHHLHSATQVRLALSMGKPVLLLVRDPLDVVVSMQRRWPGYPYGIALKQYTHYHKLLEEHISRMVISDFSETTGNLPGVLDKVNSRFGIHLNTNVDSSEHWVVGKQLEKASEEALAMRRREKDTLRAQVMGSHAKALDRARAVYRLFVQEARGDKGGEAG